MSLASLFPEQTRTSTATPVRVPPRGVRRFPLHRVPGSSAAAVSAVVRVDGRTVVRAYREPGGTWYRTRRRTLFTTACIRRMRREGVAEVVLTRRMRSVSVPLSWLS